MNKKRIVIILLVTLICAAGVGWYLYVNDYYKVTEDALAQIHGTEFLAVKSSDSEIIFYPNDGKCKTGLIIYPGGKVDFRAYAPTAKAIAQKGYKVVLLKMPQNLAIFGVNKAKDVISNNTDIEKWAIAGHSLGGAMGSQYVAKNSDKIAGVVFWASYPSKDMSKTKLRSITLYGSNDGFVKDKKIDDTKKLLPPDAVIEKIDGGNHSNFGYYGLQKGDNEASISREQQQSIVVEKMADFLKSLEK